MRQDNQSIRGLGNRLSLKNLKNPISLLLIVICMAACSGDDIEVEVILEPEAVESELVEEIEPTPEPEPEPVVETVYVPTLESWGIEDGELEIVNGNCNLPIFRKIAFPNDFTRERIGASQPSRGGPECLDDDNEGSIIEVPCVPNRDFIHGYHYICISHEQCDFVVENNDGIDYCKVQPGPLFTVASGRTNFYDNLFKRSTFYLDNRGRERHTNNAKSFIMAPTHIGGSLRRPSGNVAGKLYGRYNPGSQEYEDRKALWEACGIGTDPQIGSEKEDGRTDNGINGEWQETRTVTRDRGHKETRIEICLRLDTLPGAVKCLVTGFEDKVMLHTHDGEEELDVEIREKRHHKLCALFDEG